MFLCKKGEGDLRQTQRHREEGHVKREEKIGMMLPEAKEHQEPPELEEATPDVETSGEVWLWQHTDFRLLLENKFL